MAARIITTLFLSALLAWCPVKASPSADIVATDASMSPAQQPSETTETTPALADSDNNSSSKYDPWKPWPSTSFDLAMGTAIALDRNLTPPGFELSPTHGEFDIRLSVSFKKWLGFFGEIGLSSRKRLGPSHDPDGIEFYDTNIHGMFRIYLSLGWTANIRLNNRFVLTPRVGYGLLAFDNSNDETWAWVYDEESDSYDSQPQWYCDRRIAPHSLSAGTSLQFRVRNNSSIFFDVLYRFPLTSSTQELYRPDDRENTLVTWRSRAWGHEVRLTLGYRFCFLNK